MPSAVCGDFADNVFVGTTQGNPSALLVCNCFTNCIVVSSVFVKLVGCSVKNNFGISCVKLFVVSSGCRCINVFSQNVTVSRIISCFCIVFGRQLNGGVLTFGFNVISSACFRGNVVCQFVLVSVVINVFVKVCTVQSNGSILVSILSVVGTNGSRGQRSFNFFILFNLAGSLVQIGEYPYGNFVIVT